jgi:ribosomal protein S2
MITIEDLLDAGVHFGHRVTKWNPRMAPFIFGERNKIHIIDLVQTLHYLQETTIFLKNWKVKPVEPTILFVGTKKQASASIERVAKKIPGSHYVNHRWLGGLLTNWATMKICIDRLNSLDESVLGRGEVDCRTQVSAAKPIYPATQTSETRSVEAGLSDPVAFATEPGTGFAGGFASWFASQQANKQANQLSGSGAQTINQSETREALNLKLPKKEQAILKKQYQKLNTYFGGIKEMKNLPNLVVIVGQDSEMNAVRECQKLQNISETNSKSNERIGSGNSQLGFGNQPASLFASQQSNGIRTITILDTNSDPLLTDLFIPGNDDSTKSIDLILNTLADSLI